MASLLYALKHFSFSWSREFPDLQPFLSPQPWCFLTISSPMNFRGISFFFGGGLQLWIYFFTISQPFHHPLFLGGKSFQPTEFIIIIVVVVISGPTEGEHAGGRNVCSKNLCIFLLYIFSIPSNYRNNNESWPAMKRSYIWKKKWAFVHEHNDIDWNSSLLWLLHLSNLEGHSTFQDLPLGWAFKSHSMASSCFLQLPSPWAVISGGSLWS